jgi:hypothetical protein
MTAPNGDSSKREKNNKIRYFSSVKIFWFLQFFVELDTSKIHFNLKLNANMVMWFV